MDIGMFNYYLKEKKLFYLYIIIILITFFSLYLKNRYLFYLIPIIFLFLGFFSNTKNIIILLIATSPFYGVWLFPNNERSLYYLILPLILFFILTKLKKIKIDRENSIVLLLIFLILLSALFSTFFSFSSLKYMWILDSLITIMLALILYIFFRNSGNLSKDIMPLLIISVILSGIYSIIFPEISKLNRLSIGYEYVRVCGCIGDPNGFSRFLGLILFFILEYKPFSRFVNIIFYLITVVLIILTFSKLGLILLIINLFYLFIKIFEHYKSNFNKLIISFLLFVLIFVSPFFLVTHTNYGNILESRLSPSSIVNMFESGTFNYLNSLLSDRLYIWTSSLKYWLNRDFLIILFGRGPRMITEENEVIFGRRRSLHNTYLNLFFNHGIFVLVLYILWLTFILKNKNITLILLVIIPTLFLTNSFRWDLIFIYYIIDGLYREDRHTMNYTY